MLVMLTEKCCWGHAGTLAVVTEQAVAAGCRGSNPGKSCHFRCATAAVGVTVAGIAGAGGEVEAVVCRPLRSTGHINTAFAARCRSCRGDAVEYPSGTVCGCGLEAVPGYIIVVAVGTVEGILVGRALVCDNLEVARRCRGVVVMGRVAAGPAGALRLVGASAVTIVAFERRHRSRCAPCR